MQKKIVGMLVVTLLITTVGTTLVTNISGADWKEGDGEKRDDIVSVSSSESQSGEVKFKAHVITNESSGDIPICYGAPHCDMEIIEILYDPYNLLSSPSNISVCFNKTRVQPPTNLTVCMYVEVYGYYWKQEGPMQYIGHVCAMQVPYYVKLIDEISPKIEMTKPKEGCLYIFDNEIMPLPWTIIIGPVTIEVDAEDYESGVTRVEFYIDDQYKTDDTEEPYSWTWDEFSFGMHTIKVIAYDNAGNTAEDSLVVWKFF